jgi:hypothetical protein
MEKKHKLLLVTPSGREINLGYLSPTRNGFVLGASQVEGVDTSHLTVFSKGEVLSSHITPQEHPQDRQYFPDLKLKDFAKTIQRLLDPNLLSPLSTDQMSEEVTYVSQRFMDWLDSIKNALYEKRTSKKEIIHVINFKQYLEKLPKIVEEFQESPSLFFGQCKANEILEDPSKILGLTSSRMFVIPLEDQLYLADFYSIINFNPLLEQQEVSGPLSEIYRGMGISEYMREVEKKKIVEKLLSKANEKL